MDSHAAHNSILARIVITGLVGGGGGLRYSRLAHSSICGAGSSRPAPWQRLAPFCGTT